jgi:hypothetical protein
MVKKAGKLLSGGGRYCYALETAVIIEKTKAKPPSKEIL